MSTENRTFPNTPIAVEAKNVDISSVTTLNALVPGCTHAVIQASCGPLRITIDGTDPALESGEDDTAAVGMYVAKSGFAPDVISKNAGTAKLIGTRVNVWGYKQP